jgi:hypothetical protein
MRRLSGASGHPLTTERTGPEPTATDRLINVCSGLEAVSALPEFMTAGALLVFSRFETKYSRTHLSDAMARVMSYFASSVLGSFGALLNVTVMRTFEPTLAFVAS